MTDDFGPTRELLQAIDGDQVQALAFWRVLANGNFDADAMAFVQPVALDLVAISDGPRDEKASKARPGQVMKAVRMAGKLRPLETQRVDEIVDMAALEYIFEDLDHAPGDDSPRQVGAR